MGDVKEVELLPCPFCGGKAIDAHLGGTAWFIDAEHEPDCHFAAFQRSEEAAITAWNTRPASTGKGEGWGADREAVARIVDPKAFATLDEERARVREALPAPMRAHALGDVITAIAQDNLADMEAFRIAAYAKADLILALTVSPFKGGGNQGSLNVAAKPSEGGE